MKKIIQLSIIILIVVLYSGCKKDDTGTNNTNFTIYGLWQVTSSPQLPNLKFVKFTSGKMLFTYSQTPQSFRSTVNNNFNPSADQIVANFQGGSYSTVVYNYSVTGDVLTVIGDNGQVFLTATKSTSTDPDNWTTDVSSSDHIDNLFTNNNEGIGYDGSNLLFADYNNGKIIKVSLATRTITSEITTVTSLNTVEYDGTNYWVSRNGWSTIEKINSAGASIFTSSSSIMQAWIYGVGYVSPSSIICYAGNGQTIYNYNPVSDIVAGSLALPGIQLGDIAINNGKIFIAQRGGNFIYRFDPVSFAVEKTYRVTDAVNIYGIASVGSNNFWLNTNNGKTVLKVTLN